MKSIGALILAIPYLGKSRILKVFTEDTGLITLITRNQSLVPFCIGEWVYHERQSEIFPLQDQTIFDDLANLKESYPYLRAAGSMAQDLLSTQLPSKSSPALYHLFTSYLKKLPQFPTILPLSFRMKLLLHEGLLILEPHALPISFSPDEWETLHTLTFSRSFSAFKTLNHSPLLEQKINLLFMERKFG